MTLEQWFAESNPDALLALVGPSPAYWVADASQSIRPATRRQLRLFAVACARMVWDVLPTDARSAVLISERYAEGRARESDLRAASVRVHPNPIMFQQYAVSAAGYASRIASVGNNTFVPINVNHYWNPTEAARSAAKSLATRTAGHAPRGHPINRDWQSAWDHAFLAARATQAAILRDIVPPPDYAPRLERDWLTSTVVAIARQADETGDFSAAPILADALQDAGCDDDTLLQCCRVPGGVHVRGNWVVDLVLGRA